MIQSIAISTDASELLLINAEGTKQALSAIKLRKAARDAGSLRERLDNGDIEVAENITITGLQQVGSTGLNIKFSDGNHRAIYPIAYLNELMQSIDK